MLVDSFQDIPKLLRDSDACKSRRAQLTEQHIAPLSKFVQQLRSQVPNGIIPEFDPWDGGIDAEVLYLLEAPGPKASLSGFISRNNPDETAKNFFVLNMEAGIPRKRTISWNAVPWYIGTGTKIRGAKTKDINEGLPSLFELITLLPKLRAIVLMGRKAEYASKELELKKPDLKIFRTPHPSPLYCNRAPANRQAIRDALHEVALFLFKI